MKKLNNKGYMLVEIILAFAITFALIYFIMDIVINLKNKNDDLMVETIITTDKTIITNSLMEYAINEEKDFNCSSLKVENNTVKYKDKVIDIVSEYGSVGSVTCNVKNGKVSINIPIKVEQMKNKDFDVVVDYKYDIGDNISPTCALTIEGTKINATYDDPGEKASGIDYYGWNPLLEGEKSDNITIDSAGDYIFYVTDKSGNQTTCSVNVENTERQDTTTERPASKIYNPTGSCRCSPSGNNNMYIPGTCELIDRYYQKTTCECRDGYYLRESNCSSEFAEYYCEVGNLSGEKCIIPSNTYICSEDYTKINNSYCYKVTTLDN